MASVTVYIRAHIQAILTMELNAGNSLGNQRRVQQVNVDQFEGEYGMATAPMLRRGSLIKTNASYDAGVNQSHL